MSENTGNGYSALEFGKLSQAVVDIQDRMKGLESGQAEILRRIKCDTHATRLDDLGKDLIRNEHRIEEVDTLMARRFRIIMISMVTVILGIAGMIIDLALKG